MEAENSKQDAENSKQYASNSQPIRQKLTNLSSETDVHKLISQAYNQKHIVPNTPESSPSLSDEGILAKELVPETKGESLPSGSPEASAPPTCAAPPQTGFDIWPDLPQDEPQSAGGSPDTPPPRKIARRRPSARTPAQAELDRIYEAYPRHVARANAEKAIAKALTKKPFSDLMAATVRFAEAVKEWPEDRRQYIPHPATWFNGCRYEDDPGEWQQRQTQPVRVNGVNPMREKLDREYLALNKEIKAVVRSDELNFLPQDEKDRHEERVVQRDALLVQYPHFKIL